MFGQIKAARGSTTTLVFRLEIAIALSDGERVGWLAKRLARRISWPSDDWEWCVAAHPGDARLDVAARDEFGDNVGLGGRFPAFRSTGIRARSSPDSSPVS